jgi:hypothetical protein
MQATSDELELTTPFHTAVNTGKQIMSGTNLSTNILSLNTNSSNDNINNKFDISHLDDTVEIDNEESLNEKVDFDIEIDNQQVNDENDSHEVSEEAVCDEDELNMDSEEAACDEELNDDNEEAFYEEKELNGDTEEAIFNEELNTNCDENELNLTNPFLKEMNNSDAVSANVSLDLKSDDKIVNDVDEMHLNCNGCAEFKLENNELKFIIQELRAKLENLKNEERASVKQNEERVSVKSSNLKNEEKSSARSSTAKRALKTESGLEHEEVLVSETDVVVTKPKRISKVRKASLPKPFAPNKIETIESKSDAQEVNNAEVSIYPDFDENEDLVPWMNG